MGTVLYAGGANGVAHRPPRKHETLIRTLSDRLVEAQRPIRILDAVKWDQSVERAFFASGCRKLPPVTRDYYAARPLPFDPESKRREFRELERDLRRKLGADHPAGRIMARMCQEYRRVIDLLECRGTRDFGAISFDLYGSSADRIQAGEPALVDLGKRMAGVLDNLARDASYYDETALDAAETVRTLSSRLTQYFGDPSAVRVRLSDGIVADAAAGCDYIKIRDNATFTARDVRLLEVHEGWVHLGTTLNGQRQPVCTFLGKGPPSSTVTQEGLAVLTEFLSLASHPARIRRLTRRIEGIALAEGGANFLEVYRFFLREGYVPRDSYRYAMRIFRGSLPTGCGPFTKDLCYGKGFLLVYQFLRQAMSRGEARLAPLLFCGKTNLADLPTLAHLVDEGLVAPPRYLPPPFADLHGLSAWLCFADFCNGHAGCAGQECPAHPPEKNSGRETHAPPAGQECPAHLPENSGRDTLVPLAGQECPAHPPENGGRDTLVPLAAVSYDLTLNSRF